MIDQRKGKPDALRDKGYIDGYIYKEAAPSATELSAAIGAALGIGSGTLANFILSKMLGYEGNWMNYVGSGLAGGLAGGLGGAAAGDAVKKRIDYYRANPGEVGDILRKIEQDPRLRKVGDAIRKNPLMRPIRRALGRPFVALKKPWGYETSEIKENFDKSVKDIGLRKTLAKAIKGERLWDTSRDLKTRPFSDEDVQRILAQRAYFDLPLDESQMAEHFVVDKQDPKTWRFVDDSSARDEYDSSARDEIDRHVRAKFHGYDEYSKQPTVSKVKAKGDKEFVEGRAPFVAGYRATRDKGSDVARVADRWDYENYRPGLGYEADVSTDLRYNVARGYKKRGTALQTKREVAAEKERALHSLKNILDVLLGNPITLKQDIDISKKSLPKEVQERM